MEKFSRVLRGYDPDEVNSFLDKVIAKVEAMIKEIDEKDKQIASYKTLEEENKKLNDKIAQFSRMEENLKRAILMAEKTSEQIRLTAYQERDIIVGDAKKNANRIVNEALLKAEEIEKETDNLRRNMIVFKKRLREALETQLELVEDIEKIDI